MVNKFSLRQQNQKPWEKPESGNLYYSEWHWSLPKTYGTYTVCYKINWNESSSFRGHIWWKPDVLQVTLSICLIIIWIWIWIWICMERCTGVFLKKCACVPKHWAVRNMQLSRCGISNRGGSAMKREKWEQVGGHKKKRITHMIHNSESSWTGVWWGDSLRPVSFLCVTRWFSFISLKVFCHVEMTEQSGQLNLCCKLEDYYTRL